MEALTSIGPLDEFRITAKPGDYDGYPPVSTFQMDYTPLSVASDRLTLAVYLLFRPWISGHLTMVEPSSTLLAEAVRRHSGFGQVQLFPVTLRALPIPGGRKQARISWTDTSDTRASIPLVAESGCLDLTLLRSDQATGSLRTGTAAAISSNAFALADSTEREWEVAAAVCCLIAGDLDIFELRFPDDGEHSGLARLLRNVGLTVRLPGQ